jgi:excinuclease ABC subunit C
MTTDDFRIISPSLPDEPGVYHFIDGEGGILYVGKAKNLKNRLSSYFGERKDMLPKTRVMVKYAQSITFTIVKSEQDALLLECSLIKKHQPRYNVMLKDGKNYPYICIKNERFPRVFSTRKLLKDGSKYYGPYTSGKTMLSVLELIKQLFPLRTCPLNLAQDLIDKGRYKVCLEYHIKNCQGPCAALESETDYQNKIEQIRNILNGKFSAAVKYLREQMTIHAENLQFEQAQDLKNKLDALLSYQGKSTVVNPDVGNLDVFAISQNDDQAFVQYLRVADGAVINSFTLEMTKNLNDDPADLLTFAIQELRTAFHSNNPETIVPIPITLPYPDVKITIPKIGDKAQLLKMAEDNANYYKLRKQKEALERQNKQTPTERVLRLMQQDLHLEALPIHIECFDNSNIQGAFPVASMVVFKNAKPSKKDYRHFNIKTVEGPNDFASMEEVVYRRYKRLLDEDATLPQLIVIDGGKGQLAAAIRSLQQLQIYHRVNIIGIAKRLEEIYYPDDATPLHLNKRSESLKIIQHIRNEAHRFAITFHRQKRSQHFTDTELTDIKGIGSKTAEKLLTHFHSVKAIRNTTFAQLAEIVGDHIAQKIRTYFDTNSENINT